MSLTVQSEGEFGEEVKKNLVMETSPETSGEVWFCGLQPGANMWERSGTDKKQKTSKEASQVLESESLMEPRWTFIRTAGRESGEKIS